jgi:hypothetical protein
VRSIQESCLDRLILFGEKSLRTAMQILSSTITPNGTIGAWAIDSSNPSHLGNTGAVQQREHLGGMLNYYSRAAT